MSFAIHGEPLYERLGLGVDPVQSELAAARCRRYLTPFDFHAATGINLSRIVEVEYGDPHASTVRRYAADLGVIIRHRVTSLDAVE